MSFEEGKMQKFGSGPLVKVLSTLSVIPLLCLMFEPAAASEQMWEAGAENDYPEHTEITFSIEHNVSVFGGAADEVKVYQPLPFDIPQQETSEEPKIQEVLSIDSSPDFANGIPSWDSGRNIWSKWELKDTTGDVLLKSTISMISYSYLWELGSEDAGAISDIPEAYKDTFLGDDWPVLFEEMEGISTGKTGETGNYRYYPSHAGISDLSSDLIGRDQDLLTSLKEVYQWMMENVNRSSADQRERDKKTYGSFPKHPGLCLESGYGSGEERSLLMASLLRAAGIPAWISIGFYYNGKNENSQILETGWLNVPIPLIESGQTVIVEIDLDRGDFLFHSPFRYAFWTDDGSYIDRDGEQLHNLRSYHDQTRARKSGLVQVDFGRSFSLVSITERGSYDLPGEEGGPDNGLSFPGKMLMASFILLTSLLLAAGVRKRR